MQCRDPTAKILKRSLTRDHFYHHICSKTVRFLEKTTKWNSLNVENQIPEPNCAVRSWARNVPLHSCWFRIGSLINWMLIRSVRLGVLPSQGKLTQCSSGGRGLNVNLSHRVIAARYTTRSWKPAKPAPAVELLFFELQTREDYSISNS